MRSLVEQFTNVKTYTLKDVHVMYRGEHCDVICLKFRRGKQGEVVDIEVPVGSD